MVFDTSKLSNGSESRSLAAVKVWWMPSPSVFLQRISYHNITSQRQIDQKTGMQSIHYATSTRNLQKHWCISIYPCSTSATTVSNTSKSVNTFFKSFSALKHFLRFLKTLKFSNLLVFDNDSLKVRRQSLFWSMKAFSENTRH